MESVAVAGSRDREWMAEDQHLTVFEDDDFALFQCADVDVPGYLILTFKGNPRTWDEPSGRQITRLGGMIGKVVEALRATVGPERVYVGAFGEQMPSVHFHLFPRHAWMADLFRERVGPQPIDGPALLSLIRRERSCPPSGWSDPAAVREAIRGVGRRLDERMKADAEAEGDGW